MHKFSEWLKAQEYIDSGPFPDAPTQDQRFKIITRMKDATVRKKPKRDAEVDGGGFAVHGGDPLPGNKRG